MKEDASREYAKAAGIAAKFVPSAELNEDEMAAFEGDGEAQGMDMDLWNAVNGGGQNNMFGANNMEQK